MTLELAVIPQPAPAIPKAGKPNLPKIKIKLKPMVNNTDNIVNIKMVRPRPKPIIN